MGAMHGRRWVRDLPGVCGSHKCRPQRLTATPYIGGAKCSPSTDEPGRKPTLPQKSIAGCSYHPDHVRQEAFGKRDKEHQRNDGMKTARHSKFLEPGCTTNLNHDAPQTWVKKARTWIITDNLQDRVCETIATWEIRS